MNFYRFSLLLVSLIQVTCAIAQPKNPLFYHVYADYGITSDKTTVIHEDHQGYIWIGTEEGLNKFISYTDLDFDQYKSSRHDSSTLINDHITSIFEDSFHNLWVGSLSGLCLYNRAFDNFERICNRHTHSMNKKVLDITEFNGHLWVATEESMFVYDVQADSIINNYQWEDQKGRTLQFNTFYSTGQELWIGTSEGLFVLDQLNLESAKGFENMHVTSIEAGDDGNFFIGTKLNGLIKLNKDGTKSEYNTTSTPAITSNQINDILKAKDGLIWIATNSGVTYLDESNNTSQFLIYDFNNYYGLSDHEIRKIFQDNSDAIWLTTPLGGINYYHESDNQFDYYGQKTSMHLTDELMDNNILSLFGDQLTNSLWIGSRLGLSIYSEKNERFTHYPLLYADNFQNYIHSIDRDSNGLFWIGTEKGLYTWDVKLKKYEPIDLHPDFKDKINKVMVDNQDVVWIGTQSKGLKRLGSNLNEFDVQFTIAEDQVEIININDIIQLPDSSIWVGTTSGLYKAEHNQLISKPIKINNESINNSWVNFLSKSTQNELIVGTKQEGVIILKENEPQDVVMINKNQGLPTNDIRSLLRHSDEMVWISTNAGLTKLTTIQDSVIKATNFYLHDGLQGKQFTPKAGVSLNNNVYFGGLSGLTFFDPEKIKEFDLPLIINLTDLHINDELIEPSPTSNTLHKAIGIVDTLILEPNQNNFTISYMAMDYMRPDSVKYRYKLTKYDKDWMHSTERSATYTNIPRGKHYTFTVQAISRFRNWSEPRTLVLILKPYFYETAWFKILVAFLIVGIMFGILRYREQSAAIKRRNLQRLVDLRTKELKLEIKAKEQTTLELEKAKNDAEKANRIKSEFLANISHEIRTPLNGILGMSHLVADNEPNQENKEMLGILSRSAESLREIIDDLLDLSKIEAGKFDITSEEFDLPKLLEEISRAFQPEANFKGIELKAEIDDKIPHSLIGDELRLKQIIVNLLSNSLKFTESGSIDVIAKMQASDGHSVSLFLGVRDTGIGIPEDKQDDIFSSFTQVESGSKRKYGGTGLGLAICKKLISLMGGKIWVESTFGDGSFFKAELNLKHTSTQNTANDFIPSISIPEGRNVLLVEDNTVNTIVARKMLDKTKQNVDTASNGHEGLKMAEENQYDLILMDVQMPVMDGLEATVRIRQLTNGSELTPIVALTAGAMQKDKERALSVGMNDFLAKPINYDQLAKMLAKYLNNPEEVPSMPK